jgi:uncharacterized membrane protein YozB (DUF420 family)/glucose/arabinose dehydrogenase
MELSRLPAINATLNGASALFLAAGYVFIKRRSILAHKICMGAALAVSGVFLASYLYYHAHVGATRFSGTGWIRPVYFTILVSHTILATAILPLILATFYRAWRAQWERHVRLARWAWPLWMYVSITGVVIYLMLYKLSPPAAAAEGAGVRVEEAFPALRFELPLFLAAPPDGTDRVFVAEQDGRVWRFDNRPDAAEKSLVLDISKEVRRVHNEEGLLGLAFHPKFKENGRMYIHYSAGNPRRNVLSFFRLDRRRETADPASEEIVLEVEQPYGNHNGGMIAFGPDGYLYVALGDGGAAGDPHGHGQSKKSLLGKILRLDADRRSPGLAYAVPPDNPFAGRPGARGEIWALGLRNPWRFSFDRETGALWAGDVGQDKWEEINIVKKGGNYGWNCREGRHAFKPCPPADFIEPAAEHGREEAQSVTGGYVYRGKKIPWLAGRYVYGDFMTGNIWALREGETPASSPGAS